MKTRIYTTKKLSLHKAVKKELRAERYDKIMFLFIISVITIGGLFIIQLSAQKQTMVDCSKWKRYSEDYPAFQVSENMKIICEEYDIYLYD